MNWRHKLTIDHYLGGCVAWLLNVAARLIAFVAPRDHSLARPPRTVLFLKFVGLGSISRASCLLPAVRERFPAARIAFACFPGCAGLVRMYPRIDDVRVVRDSGLFALVVDTLRLIVWTWRNGVDLVIDLEVHSKYSSIVTGLSLARDRAGFGGITSLFRRGLYTHLVFWNPVRRIDLPYRQLGRALGLNPVPRSVPPRIPDDAVALADAVLRRIDVRPGDRILGVNPNASELLLERRWPAACFVQVIRALPAEPRTHVLFFGSSSERRYVESLCASIAIRAAAIHNLAGELSFPVFVALLTRLTLFLTNDSGPLHVATALDVPTVSLWGPSHPTNYSPRADRHTAFYRPIYCSPCVHFTDTPPCGGDNQCLQRLPWQPVARAVCRMLDLPAPAIDSVGPLSLQGRIPGVPGYWRRDSVPLPREDRRHR